MLNSPPIYALSLLKRLNENAEQAYLVGGCVRDLLLGRRPNDWDICTSAVPERVMELFPHSHPTGIKHGTVTVISRGRPVEVTTFRTDGPYNDHRHPEYVSLTDNLADDLSRRDFTINSMAMDLLGEITDLYSGRDDLSRRIIRCVGDPEKRFSEDALRILRALRFSAQLDFCIEEKTMDAAKRLAPLTAELAAERVRTELEKVLLSPRPETAEVMLSMGLIKGASLSGKPELYRLSRVPKRPVYRWAALCALLKRQGCIASEEEFLTSLRLDSRTIKTASDGAAIALNENVKDAVTWKRLLARYGTETCRASSAVMDALYGRGHRHTLNEVIESGQCHSIKELAIDGSVLQALGFQGRATGLALNALLDHVIEHPKDNTEQKLTELAMELLISSN